MIKTKNIEENNNLIETYSTENYKLLQLETNRIYGSSVIDSLPLRYTYIETSQKDEDILIYLDEENEVTQEEIAQAIESIL